jgi:hypothetical protein
MTASTEKFRSRQKENPGTLPRGSLIPRTGKGHSGGNLHLLRRLLCIGFFGKRHLAEAFKRWPRLQGQRGSIFSFFTGCWVTFSTMTTLLSISNCNFVCRRRIVALALVKTSHQCTKNWFSCMSALRPKQRAFSRDPVSLSSLKAGSWEVQN